MTESEYERVQRAVQNAHAEIPWTRLVAQRRLKRALDIVISLVLIILTFPLLILTALLVRLTSKGPVFFFQERLGLGGKPYTIYKFRTMTAEKHELMEVTTTDPRLTTVGAFLRVSRLDELPQLVQVLRGQMSLVGPRPEVPENLPRYSNEQLVRFAVPQGCTTWGVVRGGHLNDWCKRQDINVEYVWQWSFWLDLKIILGTPYVILSQTGTSPETANS